MRSLFFILLSAGLLAGCALPPREPVPASLPPPQPEAASALITKPGWNFERQAVAAAHPLAAEAGLAMLRAGGTAIDAAIAAQMVLGLVEPQSSGIGGGALLMYWDGQRVQAFDGRETAPAAADEALFLQPDGRPMGFMQAAVGGRAVGAPGAVAMLAAAHAQHGRLPWARLFEPAITLAEQGFAIGPRLHQLLSLETALARDPQAGPLFYDAQGRALAVGQTLRNPALAAVLRALASQGPQALQQGPVAADIVRRVRGHAGNPGRLSLDDLATYRPLEREALCTLWRARWRVCGFPPPSSGHLTLMQTLLLLDAHGEPQPALQAGVPGADWLHAYAEAARLAFADRAQYIADPAFVAAPGGRWDSLLDADYLRQRAALIGPRSMGQAAAGQPAPAQPRVHAPQAAQPEYGTSHLSVVDAQGRAVALTSSIEAAFGARLMSDGGSGLAGGFLLNNQLTDFALAPRDAQGRPVANRLEPGKRPRSSMSPTLVFDAASGALVASLGSPGGAAIIHFTAKALLASLGWGLAPQAALDLPNFANYNGPTLLERGRYPDATLAALRARAHQVLEVDLPSGAQALLWRDGRWWGAADPRREGVVAAD